jgi:hypothetical protein
MRASRTVLHGRNAFAATRALLEVTGTIVLQTLDQIPATPRQDWIKRFRARLDTTLLSPHSMSIAQYIEGPFRGLDLDPVALREAQERWRQRPPSDPMNDA